ncbi:MAG: SDR family oxidoreductase [Candidatus Sumerlaeia bacterium]|nr:SDR family oxidoreductase [Candidatus Sumerlaeia bacterium]
MDIRFSQYSNGLQGKVAVVTGAGRGIGRAIAIGLAANGAKVLLVSRTLSQLKETRELVRQTGGEGVCHVADLSCEADCRTVPEAAREHFGRLDLLVNNAGIGIYSPLEEATASDWDTSFALNARGAFFLCRECLPMLRSSGAGFIVNISSVTGVKGYERQAVYSASKHALMGMTKALAREVQKDNIRVHALCPGGVDTEMVAQARPDLDRSILIKPEEIADAVLFLVTRRGHAVIDQLDIRRAIGTPWG